MRRAVLAAVLLAAGALPAAAHRMAPQQEVLEMQRRAEALQRATPHADPGNVRFYQNTPYTAVYVARLCAGPPPRPQPRTCAAAAQVLGTTRRAP